MKKLSFIAILVLQVLLAIAKSVPAKQIFYAATNPNFKYVGRIDFTNPSLPRYWQPGVYVNFSFEGSECKVILNDELLWGKNHNYIEVVVDGKAVRLQTKAATDTITIAQNLKQGVHHISIVKNTEANIGYLEFVGVLCSKIVKSPKASSKKIEFIGDSITCGASSDTSTMPCGKGVWQDQHNAYLSYGPVTARALNAQYHLSSVSGIGLMHSCCGMNVIMPQVYEKVSMRNDTIAWDFKKYQPDIVTICLGQNDGVQDSATFINNYISFLQQLRTHYPAAKFVCLTSPMADEKLKVFMQKALTAVVKKMKDKRVSSYFFTRQYSKGCDSHPDTEEHSQIARELTAALKNILNTHNKNSTT